ncbi:MAG: tetratricopeptide repeat protein [Pseudomonadota bacterium]|nr:tetratricopeptide repeat protein [Pseudomonadota bacterium]
MPKLPLQFLLLWVWLATTSGSYAVSVKPQQVLDLHYGEVLFHFYQDDYFTAISHLMVARQQNLLQHHLNESELLLGGLQLSYGMPNQAERRFDRLLDQNTDAELRNRIWYYLTRISYQRGHYRRALGNLRKIDKLDDKSIGTELALLNANLHMALGENDKAAAVLENTRDSDGGEEYLRINRGIALLRAGELEEGRKTLDKLGKVDADNEELRALRDRANLGLGYELLRAGDAEQARDYLNRVRLQGPFIQAALLGAGWADAERGDYKQALTPWLELLELASYEAPVQEAHLAVPYAFAQLGDGKHAIYFYEQAIDYFDEEQQQLEAAIQGTQSGELLSLLSQADTGNSGGWLHDTPTLEGVPSGRYLVDILSSHSFQEPLKDYRDLGYLQQLLQQWLENIDLYYDMVDARRLAYQQRSPLIRQRLEKQEAKALYQRWQDYQSLTLAQHGSGDPLDLATGKEKRQWRTLRKVQATLASLAPEPRHTNMLAKASWLQGILYWQIQADYKARLWDVKKQLQSLEGPVTEATSKHLQVSEALDHVKVGFDGYDRRIAAMRERILALLPDIQTSRDNASDQLQRLALKELETRRQRLASYRVQARYALARSYDQIAQQSGEQP